MEGPAVYNEIILCIMFGSIGFFLSFFIAKTANVALMLLMVWAPMKVIEKYGMEPNWTDFYNMKDILLSMGRGMLELLSNILTIAPVGSLVLFVMGGVAGFIMNMQTKGKF